jgi:hypothetical protein
MRTNMLIYLTVLFILCISAGCGQRNHNQQKRKIEKERLQEQSRTADISEAVKATDEAGWDSVVAFQQFYDSVNAQLVAYKKQLSNFKLKVSVNHKKIPLRYRRHIRHLEDRMAALEARLATYNHTGKSSWEDFTTLYSYDLKQLERDIDKLVKRKRDDIEPAYTLKPRYPLPGSKHVRIPLTVLGSIP